MHIRRSIYHGGDRDLCAVVAAQMNTVADRPPVQGRSCGVGPRRNS